MNGPEIRRTLEKGGLLTLTVVGRKSGKETSFPVQYVSKDDLIFLLPFMGRSTNWYLNITRNSKVKITVGDNTFEANSEVIVDEKGVQQVVSLFTKRYGRKMMDNFYPKKDVAVRVPLPE